MFSNPKGVQYFGCGVDPDSHELPTTYGLHGGTAVHATHVFGVGELRLPMYHRVEADCAEDSTASRLTEAPVFITALSSDTTTPLTILQPRRAARRPHTDRQGTLHRFAPPPPGPVLGILRGGGPRGSSWVELGWSGEFHREWFVVRCSPDFEFAPEVDNG
jgi:hypothetical protein